MENKFDAITASVNSPVNIWPIGTVIPFAGDARMADELNGQGWFLCNGAQLNGLKYPRLYEVLGNACGGEAPEFGLPDMRGAFLRGVDLGYMQQGAHRDPESYARTAHCSDKEVGNVVLSRQNDQFKKHNHVTPNGSIARGKVAAISATRVMFERFKRPENTKGTATDEIGDKETRPVNVSVNYIIFAGQPVGLAENTAH